MPGILRAFDATNLNELWDSNQNSTRDSVGNYAKYVSPVVANGKVYLVTVSGQLLVYGLLAPPDFTLTSSPSQATVQAGSSATYQLTITPMNGLNSTVVLSCPSLPVGANISCSTAPTAAPAGGPVTATLTLTTLGRSAGLNRAHDLSPLYATWLLLPGMLLAAGRTPRYRRSRRYLCYLGSLLLALMLASCGGGGSSTNRAPTPAGGTPSGTYHVQVTAVSGPLTHTTSVALIVQ
jgi:hypothetical protein